LAVCVPKIDTALAGLRGTVAGLLDVTAGCELGVGVGVGLGDGVGVGTGVASGVGSALGSGVGVGLAVALGDAVGVAPSDGSPSLQAALAPTETTSAAATTAPNTRECMSHLRI